MDGFGWKIYAKSGSLRKRLNDKHEFCDIVFICKGRSLARFTADMIHSRIQNLISLEIVMTDFVVSLRVFVTLANND